MSGSLADVGGGVDFIEMATSGRLARGAGAALDCALPGCAVICGVVVGVRPRMRSRMDMGAHSTGRRHMKRTSLLVAALLMSCGCAASEVQDLLVRTPDGATLSVLVALPAARERVPAILTFDIYANPEAQKVEAARLAERGYA